MNGRYRLRLRVIEARRGEATANARARAGGSTPTPEPLDPPADALDGPQALQATDTVLVVGQPPTPPIGKAIETIPGPGAGITIDGQEQKTSTNWVQMVLVGRSDGTIQTRDYDLTDAAKLSNDVKALKGDSLVVLTGGGRSPKLDKTQRQALIAAYSQLGGTLSTTGGGDDSDHGFDTGQWSLVGIKGLPRGQAWQMGKLSPTPGSPPGDLRGFLQKDIEKNFTFVFGDHVPFDTNATNTLSGQNVMTVGSQTYTSPQGQLPPNGAAGFQVVVLDQGTLQLMPDGNRAFITNNEIGQPDVIKAMNDFIANYIIRRQPVVVMVQSLGAPWLSDSQWTDHLAKVIRYVGGTEDVFNMMVTPLHSGYALVGGTNLQNEAAEVANIAENPTPLTVPQLAGSLVRNRQGQFHPGMSGAADGLDANDSLWEIAYQPPTPFPFTGPNDQPQRGAMSSIATQLGLGAPYTDDLRLLYWQEDIGSTSLNTQLNNPNFVFYRGHQSCDCTEDQFDAVLKQIQQEFDWVVNIDGYLDHDVTPAITQAEIINQQSLTNVAQTIEDSVRANKGSDVDSKLLDLLQGGFRLAGSLLGPVSGEGGAAFTSLANVVGLVSTTANDQNGKSLVQEIEVKAGELGAEVDLSYQNALQSLDHARNLLVSDYGKLQKAGALAQTPAASGGWKPDATLSAAVTDGLEGSAVQTFYEKLMPTGYEVYELDNGTYQKKGNQTPSSYKCDDTREDHNGTVHPWGGEHSSGWQKQVVGSDGPGKNVTRPRALSTHVSVKGDGDEVYPVDPHLPSSSLTDPLFRPLDNPTLPSGGVGLTKPAFLSLFKLTHVHC